MDLLGTAIGFVILYLFIRKDIHGITPKKKRAAVKPKETTDGHVYIIANPSFRNGIFKIGLTTREVSKRLSELRTTGVPTAFQQCIILKTEDCKALEKKLHTKWASRRIDSRREFFQLDKGDMAELIDDNRDCIVSMNVDALGEALGASVEWFEDLR